MEKVYNKIKKIKKNKLIFFCIIILGIAIRVIKWPNIIEGMHCDEAMTAINANTIANYGTDMYGMSYPVFFETWKWGGQTAVLTYFMSLCIKVLGFNMMTIRLPMLIISMISIVVMYLLTNKIFKNNKIALISMLLTAISPWHILQSSFSLDCNMFPHISLIAIYMLYMRNRKK